MAYIVSAVIVVGILAGWEAYLHTRLRALEKKTMRQHLETLQELVGQATTLEDLTEKLAALEKDMAELKGYGADVWELAARNEKQAELFTQGLNNIMGFGGAINGDDGDGRA